MLFTSYEFVAFICATFLLYYIVPKKAQWVVLLCASYGFYAFSGLSNLIFIISTTLASWLIGLWVSRIRSSADGYLAEHKEDMSKEERKAYKAAEKKKSFYVLCLGLVLTFGLLAVIKYTAFALTNVNSILRAFGSKSELYIPDFILPLGISFYIFQSTAYLIDVYRGRTEAEKNPLRLALFVSFFPQLIQGPISRHSDLAPQLFEEHRFDGGVLFSGPSAIWIPLSGTAVSSPGRVTS